ncbi:MAG: basic secretory family protein [Verrucomicrobiota bacterium]|jgi:hypothetical protein|nr:basic secretory family protein [Verrucomicrobiota bacterium]
MKPIQPLTLALTLALALAAGPASAQKWEAPQWAGFHYPEIRFKDEAAGTDGSRIYHRLVPDPEAFIQQHALWVAQTLFWSATNAIPDVKRIRYCLRDTDGISAKSGEPPEVSIFYSSRWIEKTAKAAGDVPILYETRGVLYHELSHAYQWVPKGCGGYSLGTEFWIYVEGIADAVRIRNGFHPIANRRPGGSWRDGYQTTGFFLDWLTVKDPDFIRKFNRSTHEIDPWSFDRSLKKIFGEKNGVDELWAEYQRFLKGQSA